MLNINSLKFQIILILVLLLFSLKTFAQINYSLKVEGSFLKFQSRIIDINPGPNWKGYNLNKKQNGINTNIINGVRFYNNIFFAGIGFGYVNFKGINGISIFTNFEYLPLQTKLTPTINLKVGYNHIWNQYVKGTKSTLFELSGGVNYKITKKWSTYLQYGIINKQQALITPIRIGVRLSK